MATNNKICSQAIAPNLIGEILSKEQWKMVLLWIESQSRYILMITEIYLLQTQNKIIIIIIYDKSLQISIQYNTIK